MIAGKNNLVVSGCSCTKGHNLHEKGSFATYLGEMTNTKVHNVAKGGHGNEMINFTLTSYIENILKDKLMEKIQENLDFEILNIKLFAETYQIKFSKQTQLLADALLLVHMP
jgi:hypothetical protein